MSTEAEPSAADDPRAALLDGWLALTGQAAPAPGLVRLPMLSGSMSPSLPPGCTLVIDAREPERFSPGEVIVLARDGHLVAHRVLWRVRDRVLEMGDANARGAWRPAAEVVGLVVGAQAADGSLLPVPTSRRLALRGLWRHLRGRWLPLPVDDIPSLPDRESPHRDQP